MLSIVQNDAQAIENKKRAVPKGRARFIHIILGIKTSMNLDQGEPRSLLMLSSL